MTKTFSELIELKTFRDRYYYLRFTGSVGKETFGFDRYLNQILYDSNLWKRVRRDVIVRDAGFDLSLEEYPIAGKVIVHHMNPVSVDDIRLGNKDILDPEYLVCVSHRTHLAIHYGDEDLLPKDPITRHHGDTSPWIKERR